MRPCSFYLHRIRGGPQLQLCVHGLAVWADTGDLMHFVGLLVIPSHMYTNLITSLPTTWSHMTSLVTFYINDNNIVSPLESSWSGMTALKTL